MGIRSLRLVGLCALLMCSMVVGCGSDAAKDTPEGQAGSGAGNEAGSGNRAGDAGAGASAAGTGGTTGLAGSGPVSKGKGVVKLTLKAK